MKKLVLALTLGLSLSSGCLTAAHAQKLSTTGARAQIQACYNRYGQAMKTKNINVIGELLGADYVSYTMQGKGSDRTRSLNIDSFMFRMPSRITQHDTKIKSIEARGSDMIVVVETTMVSVVGSGSKAMTTKGVTVFRDFWSPYKNANGWVIRQSVERSAAVWMNGKKMQ